MSGRTIVITGASDGIGAAAARKLSGRGENVVIVGRSEQKTTAVAAELGADFFIADFADLSQVRRLANQLLERYPQIDVLANNAGGVMPAQRRLTRDGHEMTFQVNHLASFFLTRLLMDRLIESGATIINTSSVGNRINARIDIDDLEYERKFSSTKAYADTKLENILFTKELHRRYHERGISTAAFHPGNVASNFSSESGLLLFRAVFQTPLKHLILISPEKGAEEMVWLASSTPGVDWQSGEYYTKHRIGKVNKQAHDRKLAAELWERSEAILAEHCL
ncbi:SDR family NAD(P)-dependent oxidoreductase [Mycobacterium palustre]|uniref:Short-chain dehydrogenase n=1 Tax=Mycobacterium palustre TaxID=153971 RepID=A0A1X1ZWQ3_9MYCO|nr:SDR family NAD(P)-dependent oxidoreductase [Mycobacterium palustre]MCV7101383.1 SDR family NAD(P)-dependent oxidoreductase [Mycobacterium palustre]ORW28271.1 short-chain dehydrogenase [Mycobacterium palustre]